MQLSVAPAKCEIFLIGREPKLTTSQVEQYKLHTQPNNIPQNKTLHLFQFAITLQHIIQIHELHSEQHNGAMYKGIMKVS